ncbi:hypothetical protein GCM10027320_33300 [Massilia solisilvae]
MTALRTATRVPATNLKTVIPAQAGIHAKHWGSRRAPPPGTRSMGPRLRGDDVRRVMNGHACPTAANPKTVIPAKAGIHAEPARMRLGFRRRTASMGPRLRGDDVRAVVARA